MERSNNKTHARVINIRAAKIKTAASRRIEFNNGRGDTMRRSESRKGRVASAAPSTDASAMESTTASRRPSSETPDPQVADWDPIADWSIKQVAGYIHSDLQDFLFGEIGIPDLKTCLAVMRAISSIQNSLINDLPSFISDQQQEDSRAGGERCYLKRANK
jgi:hypothetical protein